MMPRQRPEGNAPDRAAVYGAGHIKRSRATKAEMEERYEALIQIVTDSAPTGVRFVYYRAATQHLIPKIDSGYNKVQRALVHLRKTGRVPYASITDSSRWMRKPRTWAKAEDALAELTSSYRRALWQNADSCVEVWCESESVAGVLWPIANKWDVPLYPIKGQTSISFAYAAAMEYRFEPRPINIYFAGDYDPAGLEIEAQLAHKLREYSGRDDITIRRLACTADQAASLQDLGTTAKKKTWRHPTLGIQPFRGKAVEVEAIDAPDLRGIVEDWITSHLDPHELAVTRMVEEQERQGLQALLDGWSS
jgi:hypothetical protein